MKFRFYGWETAASLQRQQWLAQSYGDSDSTADTDQYKKMLAHHFGNSEQHKV
jgi:hypothetical protein